MNGADPLSRARIVLCNTTHPGNIGAAARAMKTMGMSRLVLVRPQRFPDDEASARASGAADVLHDAVVCDTLPQALHGTLFAAGFTARRRELAAPLRRLREAAGELAAGMRQGEVALVFGNEAAGLSNEDLALCQLPVTIPANPRYSSLNLGAAVQLACYELRMAAGVVSAPPRGSEFALARFDEVEGLIAHLERAMRASGFLDPVKSKRLMPRLRRLFARARLEQEEVNILRGMIRSFLPKVD